MRDPDALLRQIQGWGWELWPDSTAWKCIKICKVGTLVVKTIMAMLAMKAMLASPKTKQLGPQPLPLLRRGGHMLIYNTKQNGE